MKTQTVFFFIPYSECFLSLMHTQLIFVAFLYFLFIDIAERLSAVYFKTSHQGTSQTLLDNAHLIPKAH